MRVLNGLIEVNPLTLEANIEGVFESGDAATVQPHQQSSK